MRALTDARDGLRQLFRPPRVDDPPVFAAVLAWIRTLALPDDLFVVQGRVKGFPFPSSPDSTPVDVDARPDDPRVRFVLRAGLGPSVPGFRSILVLGDHEVLERDAPHGRDRPLRLGVSLAEGRVALRHVREQASRFLAGTLPRERTWDVDGREAPRLSQRCGVVVAVWTRGRLRGSVVGTPGPALKTLGQVATWACKDSRFEPLTSPELEETLFQVTFLHAPRVPLEPRDIATLDASPQHALFASEGLRSGMYLPEIFNLARHRSLASLTASVAKEKAGIENVSPATVFEVCAVTELVESAADRERAVLLDGPVARIDDDEDLLVAGRAAGALASEWLGRIQAEDGSWPLRVRPSTGASDGIDVPRTAMTAHGLAEFAVRQGDEAGKRVAARALAWVSRSGAMQAGGANGLLVALYVAKARIALGAPDGAAKEALEILSRAGKLPPLIAAHVVSLLKTDQVEPRVRELSKGFDAATSLAEWAELAMAPDPKLSARVRTWLASKQLTSGAFPDSTTSRFAYTRGTGKIFEVLAPTGGEECRRALRWLLSMQYRPDSMFFVPVEHRPRVMGGLRHDAYDTDAWIDAAGHVLLGLARLDP